VGFECSRLDSARLTKYLGMGFDMMFVMGLAHLVLKEPSTVDLGVPSAADFVSQADIERKIKFFGLGKMLMVCVLFSVDDHRPGSANERM